MDQLVLDDKFIDQIMAEAFGYEEDQLAGEMDRIVREAGENMPKGPEGEFQKILARVEREEAKAAVLHRPVKIKKVVKMAVAAAVMGTLVLGSGMWVGAKRMREYQIRERSDMKNVIVFNNNPDNLMIDDEEPDIEKAYRQIKEELGIRVFELSYLPDNMLFDELIMKENKSLLVFRDGNRALFFYQGLNESTSSLSYSSDMEKFQQVYNPFLDRNIDIYRQELESGDVEFSVRFLESNTYYLLHGIIDIQEFSQVVCGIRLHED